MSTGAVRYLLWAATLVCAAALVVATFTDAPAWVVLLAAPIMVVFAVATTIATQRQRRERWRRAR